MSRILDPQFKYVPSASTDVRKTFRRERERLKAEAGRKRDAELQAAARIAPLTRRRQCG